MRRQHFLNAIYSFGPAAAFYSANADTLKELPVIAAVFAVGSVAVTGLGGGLAGQFAGSLTNLFTAKPRFRRAVIGGLIGAAAGTYFVGNKVGHHFMDHVPMRAVHSTQTPLRTETAQPS